MTLQTNKVHHIFTIDRVARELGENPEWLAEIAEEMEPEDGLIQVYDLSDDGFMAFTEFGLENLHELIAIHKHSAK